MTETALKALAEMKIASDADQSSEVPLDLLTAFEDRLANVEPFRAVNRGWVRLRNGGRTGKRLSSHWAWRQFKSGLSVEEVLSLAKEQVAQNSYEVLEVYPIYGLKVVKRFEIAADTYIAPHGELPKSTNYALAFLAPTYAGLPPLRHDGSALVFRITIDPAVVPARIPSEPDLLAGERAKLSFLVNHALPLLTDGPIEMPNQYTDMAIDSLVSGNGGHFASSGQPVGDRICLVRDLSPLPALVQSIDAMASKAVILSIDRLLASRLKSRLEDRILDLGIAAEIALMHDPSGGSDGKGEITAKISSRGAWLLGQDGAERLALSKELKALYSARSKVAHTGRADQALKEAIPSFDRLVVRILSELLRRGKFPDWNGLTLGAS